jgi:predicted RNase H-like HicB family nuclease
MLTRYIKAAMEQAEYELMEDSGEFFGRIPTLDGVWASAATLESCRNELEEVLEEWILVRLSQQLPVPAVRGISLGVQEVA